MNVIKDLYKANLKLKTLQGVIYRQGGDDKEIEKVTDSIGMSVTRLIRLLSLPIIEERELHKELKEITLTEEEKQEIDSFAYTIMEEKQDVHY